MNTAIKLKEVVPICNGSSGCVSGSLPVIRK